MDEVDDTLNDLINNAAKVTGDAAEGQAEDKREDDADEGDDLDFAPWDAADDFDDEELGAYDK